MSLIAGVLAAYHRSGLRGSHRLTGLLARRLSSLRQLSVATRNGIIYVDLNIASARAILADPDSHSGEERVIKHFLKAGGTVFDIGAHFGVYTLLMSRLVGAEGRVFAFEPNSEVLPSLRKTVSNIANIRLLEHALSDSSGTLDFFVPEDASMASLRDWSGGSGGEVHKLSCETRRLDDLVAGGLPLPDFVKCDVEGAELSIFEGARDTFDRVDAPIIMFEIVRRAATAFGHTPSDYLNVLRSFKQVQYSFFEIVPDGIRRFESDEIEYANVLAVPANRSQSAEALLI
ncbi:MAG: FkbM family methyltransferase [Pyrinomonadaceae bacterium]